jgi:hypothetical protein
VTFSANEISTEGGSPVELFEFALQGSTYAFTSGEEEVVVGAVTYDPVSISRSSINVGPEVRTEIISIELPSNNAFARLYIDIVPGAQAVLTIKRFHRFDGVTPEVVTIFTGVVRSVGFSLDGRSARVAVLPLTSGLSRTIPRFHYSNLCNHVLYDSGCKVVENDFRFTGNVSAVVANVYTIPGVGASVATPAASGFVRFQSIDYRLILSQSGDALTLLLPFGPEVAIGSEVDIFRGCAHDIATCKSSFDNVQNYGGFAFVPLKNIFSTGLD